MQGGMDLAKAANCWNATSMEPSPAISDTRKIVSIFDREIESEGNKLLELGWTLLHMGQTTFPAMDGNQYGNVAYFGWTKSSIPIPIADYEKWTAGGGQQNRIDVEHGKEI